MRKRSMLKAFTCGTAIASILQPTALAALAGAAFMSAFAPAADATPTNACANITTTAGKVACLRSKVKYVFVIFQENESFDHYFGTFPGANGLFSAPGGYTPAVQTPSFTQAILQPPASGTGAVPGSVTPFLMPQAVVKGGYNGGAAASNSNPANPIYPADYISVDHSHTGMANSLHVVNGVAHNDQYAMDQEGLTTCVIGAAANAGGCLPAVTGPAGATAIVLKSGAAATAVTLKNKQKAQANLSHIDCDTIPFMWSWAKNFVLFDNMHQTIVGPSTTNAIALIAGQAGQTQYALHPTEGATGPTYSGGFQNVLNATYGSTTSQSNAYVPVVGDPGPWPGSSNDTWGATGHRPPYNFDESATNTSYNLTFASLPLAMMGSNLATITSGGDQSPSVASFTTPKGATVTNTFVDLEDVSDDLAVIANNPAVNWGWYQQGYSASDSTNVSTDYASFGPTSPAANDGYVLHHNAVQYFAYLADNKTVLTNNMGGAADFFTAVQNQTLGSNGGVFYLRGGYNNNDGLTPLLPANSSLTPSEDGRAFIGNDDHPAYSDQQISEALAAKAINAIVNSPYWSQSVILITYDETDGFYDHTPISVRNTFVDGSPLAAGPRIPTILISPWANHGQIDHTYSEHSSILKLIETLFGLTPLANLPDEKLGAALALRNLGQSQYGPADDPSNGVGGMLEAFNFTNMQNNTPLSGSLATFTSTQISTLPHLAVATPSAPTAYSPNGYTNGACKVLNILPTDFANWSAYQAGKPRDPYPVDVDPRAGGVVYTN